MEPLKAYLTPMELSTCLGGITVQGVYKALKAHGIDTESTNTKRILITPDGVRKLFEERGFKYPKFNVSVQIAKGGVGKTSICLTLSVRSSTYGAKVLVIDMDQQANLTNSLGYRHTKSTPVWLNLFREEINVKDAIVKISDNLHLIPSSLNNSRLEAELMQANANLRDSVNDILAPIRDDYDMIFFDCPSALNKINMAVTCASDLIIVPLNPDSYAIDGLDYTIAELDKIREKFKLDNEYKVLWNKFDAREKLAPYYLHDIAKREDLLGKIFPVVCRVDTSLKNAAHEQKSIFDLPKRSPLREDFDQLTKEILGINQWNQSNKSTTD